MAVRHSVLLKEDKCEGCTNCVKKCPTKAIRVHKGKATIKEELCIDCGECIRTCEYHAKYTETDSLEDALRYKYPVALIPPSFYGQFNMDIKPSEIVNTLYELGFNDVWDVALAAEALSLKTARFLEGKEGPYISSSCPVVVRLIKVLYPELVEYLLPFKSPVEIMGEFTKKYLVKKGIAVKEDIGVFFLTPCPAKLTTVKYPLGQEKSSLDGAIGVEKIYHAILKKITGKKGNINKRKSLLPLLGINWGYEGGEGKILKSEKQKDIISLSGIHRIKELLDELARGNMEGVKYLELVACPEGCVGGVLNVQSPYQAKFNIEKLTDKNLNFAKQDYDLYDYLLERPFQVEKVGSLDKDFVSAMEKLDQLEKEIDILPGLDCAACGAPDCKTLAEDIVSGLAQRTDCIFMLRKRVSELADKISDLANLLPPVMSEGEREGCDESKGDN